MFCESSLIRTNLHKNKRYNTQRATGTCHTRRVPVQGLSSAEHSTAPGQNSNVPVQPLRPRIARRSKSLNTSTNKITNSSYFSGSTKRTETGQNSTMEEVDAGAGDTTDPPLLLSKQTDSPSEVGLTNFTSDYSHILTPAGTMGDLNPATTCGPQRQHLVAAGSDHTNTPTWDICFLLTGGQINAPANLQTCSTPDGVRGGTQPRGARNIDPLNKTPKTYKTPKRKYHYKNKLTDITPGKN